MDSTTAGLLGALIGSLSSIVSPIIVEFVRTRRAGRLDRIRKNYLTKLLSDPRFKWRSFETLSNSIGADDEKTIELLLEIGARRRKHERNMWALTSRVPFPVDDLQDAPPSN